MKKALLILLSLALLVSASACGEKKNSTVTETTVSDSAPKDGAKEEKEVKAEKVEIGNTITVDFAEMTIDEAAVADDIKTSIKTGNITYTTGPDRSDDKEFIYMRGTLKNTSKAEITSPRISGTVEIDGYSYELGSVSIIESDGKSAHSLSPLIGYTYTIYAEVPNELVANFTECKLNFSFEENFENIFNSDKNYKPAYNYTLNIAK